MLHDNHLEHFGETPEILPVSPSESLRSDFLFEFQNEYKGIANENFQHEVEQLNFSALGERDIALWKKYRYFKDLASKQLIPLSEWEDFLNDFGNYFGEVLASQDDNMKDKRFFLDILYQLAFQISPAVEARNFPEHLRVDENVKKSLDVFRKKGNEYVRSKIERLSVRPEVERRTVIVEIGPGASPMTFGKYDFTNSTYYGIDPDIQELNSELELKVTAELRSHKAPHEEGSEFHFLHADATKGLPVQQADVVFMSNVMGYPRVNRTQAVAMVEQIKTVLQDGGMLIIKEDNTPLDPAELAVRLFGKNSFSNKTSVKTLDDLEEALDGSGFSVHRCIVPSYSNYMQEIEKYGFHLGRLRRDEDRAQSPNYILELRYHKSQ